LVEGHFAIDKRQWLRKPDSEAQNKAHIPKGEREFSFITDTAQIHDEEMQSNEQDLRQDKMREIIHSHFSFRQMIMYLLPDCLQFPGWILLPLKLKKSTLPWTSNFSCCCSLQELCEITVSDSYKAKLESLREEYVPPLVVVSIHAEFIGNGWDDGCYDLLIKNPNTKCVAIALTTYANFERSGTPSSQVLFVLNSFHTLPTKENILTFQSSEDMLMNFSRFVTQNDPDAFLTFDSNSVLPILVDLCSHSKCGGTQWHCIQHESVSNTRWKQNSSETLEIFGRLNLDCNQICRKFLPEALGKQHSGLTFTLENLACLCKVPINDILPIQTITAIWLSSVHNFACFKAFLQHLKIKGMIAARILVSLQVWPFLAKLSQATSATLHQLLTGKETFLFQCFLRILSSLHKYINYDHCADFLRKSSIPPTGGNILPMAFGLYTGIGAFFDVRSMYPSIVKGFSVGHSALITTAAQIREAISNGIKVMRVPILGQTPYFFAQIQDKDPLVLMMHTFLVNREKEKTQIKVGVQLRTELVWKLLANSIPGLLGRTNKSKAAMLYGGWSMYCIAINHTVTTLGSTFLSRIQTYFERKGLKTLCGMTDSCCVTLPQSSPYQNEEDKIVQYGKGAQELATDISINVLQTKLTFAVEGIVLGFLGISQTEYVCCLVPPPFSLEKSTVKAPGLVKGDQPKFTQTTLQAIVELLLLPDKKFGAGEVGMKQRLKEIALLIYQNSIKLSRAQIALTDLVLNFELNNRHLSKSLASPIQAAVSALQSAAKSGKFVNLLLCPEDGKLQPGNKLKLLKSTEGYLPLSLSPVYDTTFYLDKKWYPVIARILEALDRVSGSNFANAVFQDSKSNGNAFFISRRKVQ
jgi:DNA polymerase elongation subunit (family B)